MRGFTTENGDRWMEQKIVLVRDYTETLDLSIGVLAFRVFEFGVRRSGLKTISFTVQESIRNLDLHSGEVDKVCKEKIACYKADGHQVFVLYFCPALFSCYP